MNNLKNMNNLKIELVFENISDDEKTKLINKLISLGKNAKHLNIEVEQVNKNEELILLTSNYENDERYCANCNVKTKDKDLCSLCEPYRKKITEKLDSDLDEYMKIK